MSSRPALTAVLAAASLAAAACTQADAPEPAGEETSAAMPETPDRSETAADEKGMAPEQAPQGTAPDAGPQPAN